MSGFKGTRGEVGILINNEVGLLITANNGNKSIATLWNDDVDNDTEANANLIVDAFKVRQQINCELSELLDQRNEMLAMLEVMVQEFDRENATEYEFQVCYKAKQLIKKVKKNE